MDTFMQIFRAVPIRARTDEAGVIGTGLIILILAVIGAFAVLAFLIPGDRRQRQSDGARAARTNATTSSSRLRSELRASSAPTKLESTLASVRDPITAV